MALCVNNPIEFVEALSKLITDSSCSKESVEQMVKALVQVISFVKQNKKEYAQLIEALRVVSSCKEINSTIKNYEKTN